MLKQLVFVVALSVAALAQAARTAEPQSLPAQGEPTQAAGAPVQTSTDPAAQMEIDLNQMDGLLNNMATEVSFIQNTNMQILLNTNVRLWTLLLRDLRRQVQEQQKHGAATETTKPR